MFLYWLNRKRLYVVAISNPHPSPPNSEEKFPGLELTGVNIAHRRIRGWVEILWAVLTLKSLQTEHLA